MYLWMEKIYRINEEVEEGNKKTLKRENNKNCGGGNKYVGNKKNWGGNEIEKGEAKTLCAV